MTKKVDNDGSNSESTDETIETPELTVNIVKSATAAISRIMDNVYGSGPSNGDHASSNEGIEERTRKPHIKQEDFETLFETTNTMFKDTPATTLSGSQAGERFTLPQLIEDMGELAVLTLNSDEDGESHKSFKTATMTCTGIQIGEDELSSGVEWPAQYIDSNDDVDGAQLNRNGSVGAEVAHEKTEPVSILIPSATILAATNTREQSEIENVNKTAATVSVLVVDFEATAGLFPDPIENVEGTKTTFLGSAVVSINISDTEPGTVLAEPITLGFSVEAQQAFGGGGNGAAFDFDPTEADDTADEEANAVVIVQYLPVCVWWDFTRATQLDAKSDETSTNANADANADANVNVNRKNHTASTVAGGWNSSGCTTDSDGWELSGRVNCSCNHLTHFGILFQTQELDHGLAKDVYATHERVLSAITITGVTINALCLVLMAGIFWYYLNTELYTVATKILLHMCTALVVSQLTFVSGIERTRHSSDASCSGVAFSLHYLLLVSWAWMVSEAVHLRERFITVYRPSINVRWFAVASYIVPAVVVTISAGLYHEDYGTQDMCWIRPGSPAIWFFIVPVLIALAVNTWIFINVVRAVTEEISDKWVSVKAAVTFMVTLGLTNGFGALIVIDGKLVWHYLLAIAIALQGMTIFYFHCYRRLQNRPKRKTVSNIKSAIKRDRKNKNRRRAGGTSKTTTDSGISTGRASASIGDASGRDSGLGRLSRKPPSHGANPLFEEAVEGYENPTYGQLYGVGSPKSPETGPPRSGSKSIGRQPPTKAPEKAQPDTVWEQSFNNDNDGEMADLYDGETMWNKSSTGSIDGSFLEAGGHVAAGSCDTSPAAKALDNSYYIELESPEHDQGRSTSIYDNKPGMGSPRPFSPEWDNSYMSPAAPRLSPTLTGAQIGRRYVSTPTPVKAAPARAAQRKGSVSAGRGDLTFPSESPFMKGRKQGSTPTYGLPPLYSPKGSKVSLDLPGKGKKGSTLSLV